MISTRSLGLDLAWPGGGVSELQEPMGDDGLSSHTEQLGTSTSSLGLVESTEESTHQFIAVSNNPHPANRIVVFRLFFTCYTQFTVSLWNWIRNNRRIESVAPLGVIPIVCLVSTYIVTGFIITRVSDMRGRVV